MFYIYILESNTDGHFYVGHTDDVIRRFEEHNSSDHPTYTSKHRPWKLFAAFEVSPDRATTMKAEIFIKKQKSRRFIRKIAAETIVDLPMARLVRISDI